MKKRALISVYDKTGILDFAKFLVSKGVEIISCGTCLDYFKLKEKLLVGEISNMYSIYETLFNAGKVINI